MYPKINIIGGGQLARMLTQEAQKLGFEINILDKDKNCSGGQVANNLFVGDIFDENLIQELSSSEAFWTFEIEHLDTRRMNEIVKKYALEINPKIKTLEIINDKIIQKKFLSSFGIPVAEFFDIEIIESFLDETKEFDSNNIQTQNIKQNLEFPFMLKTRKGGFDGRGNKIIYNVLELKEWREKFGAENCYIEKLINYETEISVLCVKGKFETVLYEVTENIHHNNICHRTIAPARISVDLRTQAQNMAKKIIENLEGFGCFCVEFFVTRTGELIVNEVAPRVHNSGHWTMNGSITSQFENHIRAITGLNLGSTEMTHKCSIMLNILGNREGEVELSGLHQLLEFKNLKLYLYGKTPVRLERKMGHINLFGNNLDELLRLAGEVEDKVRI